MPKHLILSGNTGLTLAALRAAGHTVSRCRAKFKDDEGTEVHVRHLSLFPYYIDITEYSSVEVQHSVVDEKLNAEFLRLGVDPVIQPL